MTDTTAPAVEFSGLTVGDHVVAVRTLAGTVHDVEAGHWLKLRAPSGDVITILAGSDKGVTVVTPAEGYDGPGDIFRYDLHAAIANHLLSDADLPADIRHWPSGAARRILDAILPTIERYTMVRPEPLPTDTVPKVGAR